MIRPPPPTIESTKPAPNAASSRKSSSPSIMARPAPALVISCSRHGGGREPQRRAGQVGDRVGVVMQERDLLRVDAITAIFLEHEVPQREHAQPDEHGVVGIVARYVDVRAQGLVMALQLLGARAQ